ncbi:MAG TPA: hypothetical protein VKQ71_17570 [Acidimicrobiales bacterium]|nr:hypothetical protein [Acidimicrobiales bacterium]
MAETLQDRRAPCRRDDLSNVWLTASFRARAAQERISELDAQLAAEHERRDRAVREAIDGGAPPKDLAKVLGVARATIYRILGTVA